MAYIISVTPTTHAHSLSLGPKWLLTEIGMRFPIGLTGIVGAYVSFHLSVMEFLHPPGKSPNPTVMDFGIIYDHQ